MNTEATGGMSFYERVNAEFYAEAARDNGGEVPAGLLGPDGMPRPLTTAPQDRAYRDQWRAVAAGMRNSRAVAGKAVTSPVAPCAPFPREPIPDVVLPVGPGKPVLVGSVKPERPPADPSGNGGGGTPKQQKVRCNNVGLAVQCKHDEKRKFKLELPTKDGRTSGEFEVIDDGKEEIDCETTTTGPCPEIHEGKVFDLNPDTSLVSKTDSRLSFRADHDPDLDRLPLSELLHPSKARTAVVYQVRTSTCEQEEPLSATIRVYPQLDWKADVSVGYKTEDGKTELALSGAVGVVVVGKKKQIELSAEPEVVSFLRFLNLAQDALNGWSRWSRFAGLLELNLIMPKVAFKGTWGWQEIEGKPTCGYVVEWEIGFDPLIGAAIKLDLLGLALNAIPVVGQIIQLIRAVVEKQLEIRIDLSLEGRISGALHRKKPALHRGDTWGEVSGKITLRLEAIAKANLFFFLHFKAKAGVECAISAQLSCRADGEGPYLQGEFKFDGMDVYAVCAGGIGFEIADPPKEESKQKLKNSEEEDEPPEEDGTKVTIDPLKGKATKELRKVYHLIDEHKLYATKDRIRLFPHGLL
jgi:hypothetical protein